MIASKAQQKEYPMIVGKLLWLANSAHPDLSLEVSVLAQHMQEPSQEHYIAAQHVLRYLAPQGIRHAWHSHFGWGSIPNAYLPFAGQVASQP